MIPGYPDRYRRPSRTECSVGKPRRMKISKSKFVAGVQCLKRLYLQVHEPELTEQSDGADETPFEQGHEVGLLARELFPGGIEVDSSVGLSQATFRSRCASSSTARFHAT
jgi:hypothetical protein